MLVRPCESKASAVRVETDGRENYHWVWAAKSQCIRDQQIHRLTPDYLREIATRRPLYGRHSICLGGDELNIVASALSNYASRLPTRTHRQLNRLERVIEMAIRIHDESILCWEKQLAENDPQPEPDDFDEGETLIPHRVFTINVPIIGSHGS